MKDIQGKTNMFNLDHEYFVSGMKFFLLFLSFEAKESFSKFIKVFY